MIAGTPLRVIRTPGPRGPIVRCSGQLSMATAEGLRRSLGLIASACREGLILNLSGVRHVDLEGMAAVLDAAAKVAAHGGRLLVVAAGETGSTLQQLGIERALHVCASEAEALAALDGPAGADGAVMGSSSTLPPLLDALRWRGGSAVPAEEAPMAR